MDVVVIGVTETIRALSRMGVDLLPIIAAALNEQHEEIMTLAKERTPVDTGALRASGHVVPPRIVARSIQSIGAFGGTAAPYAVVVHENLAAFHRVGRAKYYQSAVQERTSKIAPAIRNAVRGYLVSISR
jgi:hypothetical protein